MTRMTTSALDAYLRLLRRPFDAVAGLIPGQHSGPGAAAKLTVERFDASLRALAAAVIADPELSDPAARDDAATRDRELGPPVEARAGEPRLPQPVTRRRGEP